MGLLILLAEGLAVAVVAGIGYTIWMLTHPPRRTYAGALVRGRPGTPSELDDRPAFEAWTLESRSRELPVWDVRGRLERGRGPTLILTHGWGDSRVGALARVPRLLPLCSRLILWDMPGHGDAPGRCTLGTREVEDLVALIERAREPGVPIVLLGWSLGAGVSIVAATRTAPGTVAGVVAEAPYRLARTPARNVLRLRRLPYRWNLAPALWCIGIDCGIGAAWRRFDRAEHAARLACPLLVIHGALDEISPIEDGRVIARAASHSRILELPASGHYGLWTDDASAPTCVEELQRFLADIAAPPPRPPTAPPPGRAPVSHTSLS